MHFGASEIPRHTGRAAALTLFRSIWLGGPVTARRFLAWISERPTRVQLRNHTPEHKGAVMSSNWDAWDYRQDVNRGVGARSLVGYHVHATDGDIGKIDEASDDA